MGQAHHAAFAGEDSHPAVDRQPRRFTVHRARPRLAGIQDPASAVRESAGPTLLFGIGSTLGLARSSDCHAMDIRSGLMAVTGETDSTEAFSRIEGNVSELIEGWIEERIRPSDHLHRARLH